MSFELIDYSTDYYEGTAGEPVPEIRGGKFVQLRDVCNDREFIILSPVKLSTYHADIVERFCGLNKLPGVWNPGRTNFRIQDPCWSVVGGGRWAIDTVKKTLDLDSSSQAYGRFDSAGLKKRLLSLREMRRYAVRIDGA
ncbi:MAG: hypothetical protein HZB33_14040 [Nitrospirae bacterium]|nr:hypothetical protein [Nitrospirota bacterium]